MSSSEALTSARRKPIGRDRTSIKPIHLDVSDGRPLARLLNLPIIGWMVQALLGWIEAKATGRKIVETNSPPANDQTIQFHIMNTAFSSTCPMSSLFYCDKESGSEGKPLFATQKPVLKT